MSDMTLDDNACIHVLVPSEVISISDLLPNVIPKSQVPGPVLFLQPYGTSKGPLRVYVHTLEFSELKPALQQK